MLTETLLKLQARQNISAPDSQAVFDEIFAGSVPDDLIRALLIAFAEKGETSDEILGAAQSMRAKMLAYPPHPEAVDIVGTGGDKLGTLNISTASAIIVAACDVPVAKHGNRASSSLSGSSDVLAALGVNLEPSETNLLRCLPEIGLVFLFAPHHHPAMKHVAPVRRALGIRTIFNFLGPLTNPAGVKRHLIGVSSRTFLRPMGETLIKLGSEKAWLANSADGMDEIATTGPTHVLALESGTLSASDFDPASLGLPIVPISALQGGDAAHNAAAIRDLLEGVTGPYRDVVLLNSAAALLVADRATSLSEGISLAAYAIDKGRARQKLHDLVTITNSAP